MANENRTSEKQYPTSFGLFYPVGYLVVGFPGREDALRVQQDLMTGGYEADDCAFFSCKEVKEAAKESLDQGNFLPRLGGVDKVIEKHLEAAKEGSSFLVIMNVIRRVPFEFAHRYHRLAIEELN
jgi:hypothetical protein